MARKYSDYIRVDKDFIPVFSRHKDKEYPDKWKSFLPHESFKKIVSQTIDTLEMNSAEKELPLWASGAYGTGKTFASFVIKHMLEDDIESVKPYFESNNMMPLYARLSGIRSKGNILVVHRSSSASIVGENRFLNCIRESIKAALRESDDYHYYGEKSQYDTILSILKDPQSSFNFTNAFNKYKAKFTEYASPDSVIRDMEELDLDDSIELLETIVEVAEKENYVWSTSVNEVIDWIDDVVKGNNLNAIVFIWDEFTDFFTKNNIGGLQEIAHAASAIKFYFFLITHSTSSQLIKDQNARKVIEARFKLPIIEMADTTAFKLLGKAILKNSDLSDEWEKEKLGLWQRVEKITKNTLLRHSTDITEGELQDLLPFHPYAAHLLKIISKDISSNQRTMFQFLSGDYLEGDNIKNNFRWFIENNSNEMNGWNYLTANYIWDYFFTIENADLDEAFKAVISHYNNYKSVCSGDEDKENVLKVVLLLTAMQQKSGADRNQGMSGLLRPTLYNISACFTGTPIESSISNIMAEFVQRGVFGKVEEINDILYVSPLGNIDEDRFKQMKDEVRKDFTFEKLLVDTTYNVYQRFLPDSVYLKQRFVIEAITPTDYKTAVDKAIAQCKKSNIPMFYLFAKNEAEEAKVNSVIQKIYTDYQRDLVIVDFSDHIFTDALYEKFITSKTEERYYNNPNQHSRRELAKANAKIAVDEWKNKLDMTNLDVHTSISEVSKCQGGANLRKKMKEINASIFDCGLEGISIHENLFKPQGFKSTVAQMGMSKVAIPSNYSYLNSISTKLTNENIWTNPNYYTDNPTHIVSRMKVEIEKTIENGFKKNNMVCIVDIWEVLEDKPFGFQNCSGTLFLIGFLIKEYADSQYHKYDGANTVTLNNTDLSGLIFETMRENPKMKGQFIVKQTPEHIDFCHITGGIFKIAADKQNSIDDITKYMKVFLSNNEYPLWPLCNYIKEKLSDNDLQEHCLTAVKLFCEFVSSGNIAGRDKSKVAEELYRLYKMNAGLAEELSKIIIMENMKSGMQYYIGQYKPELTQLTAKLGITTEEYIVSLNKKLVPDSTYLWEIGDTDRQIDNLYNDYHLIDAVNSILPEKKKSFEKIADGLKDKLNLIKLPYTLLTDCRKDLVALLDVLMLIKDRNSFDKPGAIKLIQDKCVEFNTFFNNQFALFAELVKQRLQQSFEQDEIDAMFSSINTGAFYEHPDIYLQNISAALDKHRKNKKSNRLFVLWDEMTFSNSPAEWSYKHSIPILCLYQGNDEILLAQRVFGIINKTHSPQSEKEIDEAIAFVGGDSLERLKDIAKCNLTFKQYFSGVYNPLFENADELKAVIKKNVTGSVYDWISKKQTVDAVIKSEAEKNYATKYKAKVKAKIKELSPEKAQKLLEELIEDKPLVGINLLQD